MKTTTPPVLSSAAALLDGLFEHLHSASLHKNGYIVEVCACVALDGAHAAYDHAPDSMRFFSMSDVACGVGGSAAHRLRRMAQETRSRPLTTNKVALNVGGVGDPSETGDVLPYAITTPTGEVLH
ncbi:MAG: hypothetical protein ABIO96_11785 [Nitrospiraceae bacterium]